MDNILTAAIEIYSQTNKSKTKSHSDERPRSKVKIESEITRKKYADI